MIKLRSGILFFLVVSLFVFSGCGEHKSFEAGGRYIVVGENGEFIQGESGVWEVPGKYKLEVLGVFLDDTGDEETLALKNPSGNVVFEPKGLIIIAYTVTNLGYELTDSDIEKQEIDMSSMYSTFRINDGEKVNLRPYPYSDNDYKYSKVTLDYGLPLVEKGEETDIIQDGFVTNKAIDLDKDVMVFTTFFNDGTNTYDGVFEMKIRSLSKFLDENN